MTQPQIKNIFFLILACILFFLEITIFALLQRYEIFLVLCFFIALLAQRPQRRTLIIPLFLTCILSYLDTNIFGWSLVYIMPTIVFANYLEQHVRVKIIIPYVLLTFALCLKIIVGWYMHGTTISLLHATESIAYNTLCMSLFVTCGLYLQTKLDKQFSR